MNGMFCQLLTVYKGPRLVEDTQFTTSSRNPREISSLDKMCCNYSNSCGYGYGCGYGPYYSWSYGPGYGCGYGSWYGCGSVCGYGCGYGSCCGYGPRYGCGCGYGSGCYGYRPFCYRRCYSSCC
ncbi:keratin-associated protein 21-1-like [Acinonyx jubatus]|uniref:Keratin-associated protein 21-1-like n=1 Tax=Acinonyx jubatus TaxID=32536 RepID=A0ABM3PXD8_ACIJB|nr:keratin-associated protein 21-1-like [Acinonyx jubatus]